MTDAPRDFWITLYDGMAWDSLADAKRREDGFNGLGLGIVHVREVPPPQPRTLYLCEVPDGGVIPFSTSIEAKKRALSYGSGATVSEWEEKL